VSVQFPAIEPYESGLLDVGDGHEVYWESCGNPAAPRHFSCTVVLARAARQVSGTSSIRAFIAPYCSTSAGSGPFRGPRSRIALGYRQGASAMGFPPRDFLHLAAGAAALPAVSRIAWAQT
jgi:hypothetical protein